MSDSYPDTTEARPLVVDDDRVIRITISKVLNKAGYAVVKTEWPAGSTGGCTALSIHGADGCDDA